ncbi:S-layer homology domain-containing protein [Lysinibacillus sp. G4S2]|uniref:S-layer homology domain-containing protein n=1 Tax=Lysinibacillus sp. G4S2 TaxID=3055859 RepID=UPI0025A22245|nr:S-layer homology domain-containing protein [Lysinibacillus sp. G4S2]MDM5246426.1 S-layer homology domain-containing protein [Lysinibacillus sp. G4S2]
MANQPKKYKKFVATAATATLVASAIVPVASAAGFTDVAGNSHEASINALADKGIINGYSDGTFKPNQTINRGQVVKLLGRWLETEGFEVPADWDTKQRFNDLPLTAEKELVKYAALAKDAGVFAGSNGNLNYTQTMQRQQMAVVLVRAINEIYELDLVKEYKAAGFKSEISDLDKAFSAEQREAITALEYAKLTNAASLPGKAFNPANSITRGQFASFLDRTINLEVPSKASVKAINNTTVEVTFDKEVDNVQALNFEIKDLEVKNAAVKLTDKKVVVLTTAPQTADKEYKVSLNAEEIGKFKGVNAVVPTKVDLVEKSTQGKLGQQVTLKAQVTVAEGASKAGVPVTFFIPGSANGVKAPVTVEAVTNDQGIATYTYTRYAATNDTVTVYANGDRSKFSTGYVFWAVDQTLTITEVTTGSTINNGANKTYKVAYKDPDTGKPVSGKTLNVSVKENIDVTVDKLQNVSINGTKVAQTNNVNPEAAQIVTDSKGEATFTVTGSNAEVTPVVFVGEAVTGQTAPSKKYAPDALQASAGKVTFGAVQSAYTIELNRDGGEVAATGATNGRKYKMVVKDKDGKLAANETVNIAFNEDIDGVISTVTDAQFVKVENGKQVGFDGKKITVKTDSKGEASFVIGTAEGNVNTYATPIAWIDINNQSGKDANLDKGEPSTIAPISYFQAAYLDGSKLIAKNDKGDETEKYDGSETATFEVQLTNQSGKVVPNSGYTTKDVSYTVYNTGKNNVLVDGVEIAPNRVHTLISKDGKIKVTPVKGESTSVKVLATGVAKEDNKVNGKEFAFTAKEATATFTDTKEITNPYTGVLDLGSIDKKEKEIKFEGKTKAVAYAGETGKTYKYFGIGNTKITDADAFIALLEEYKTAGKKVRATYEVKDDVVTFTIISENAGTSNPSDVVAKVNAATTAAEVEAAIKDLESYKKLTDANKKEAVKNIFDALQHGQTFTSASLKVELERLVAINVTAAYKAGVTGAIGKEATAVYANKADATKTLEIASKEGATEYNGVKVVFEKNTDKKATDVVTVYENKTLKVLLPVNEVTGAVNTTFEKVETALKAFNSGDLTVKLTGLTGDASELEGQTIELKGATATTPESKAKVVLTFSEAVNVPAGTLDFVVTHADTTTATISSEAVAVQNGVKTLTLEFAVDPKLTATDTITLDTDITPVLAGQTFGTPVKVTVTP